MLIIENVSADNWEFTLHCGHGKVNNYKNKLATNYKTKQKTSQ